MSDTLELEARIKNYLSSEANVIVGSLGKIEDASHKNVKASNDMERAMHDLSGSWNIGKIALGSLVGALGATSIFRTVTGFFKDARAEYQENVLAQQKLSTALGYTSKALADQASAISQKLIVDDSEITKVQAMLANYVKNEEQLLKLTPAILDLAAAMGTDMVSAATLVAKSINGDSAELGRYQINIEGAAGSTEKIDSVISELNKKVKGQAAALAEAKDGWNAFGVTYESILQSVGKSDFLKGTGDLLNQWAKGVKIIVDSVFKETVSASQSAINQLNAVSNQASIITGVWKDRQKIFDQVSMMSHQGRLDLYKKQYQELYDQAVKANDLIAADSIKVLYYGPNGIIPKEKQAEQDRIENVKKSGEKRIAQENKDTEAIYKMYRDLEESKKIVEDVRITEGTKNTQQLLSAHEALKTARINSITDEYLRERTLLQEKHAQELKEVESNELAKATLIKAHNQELSNFEAVNKKKQKDDDRTATSNKISNAEKYTDTVIGTFSTIAKASKAGSGLQKGLDIAQATANTALGVSKAIATGQLWMIPFALATGMAQVAIISQQQYRSGGIVPGSPSRGDSVSAMLTPGEMILNKEQQTSLFDLLQRPNVSNSSSVALNIQVGAGGTYDMNAARYTVDALAPIIGEVLTRAKTEGRLRNYEAMR